MKIKKGDLVKILRGKDRGKIGKILEVSPQEKKVIIEGANLLIKHVRPRHEGEKGQRVKVPAPLDISKVALVCPKCHQPIRVGYRILADGKKMRWCRKCGETFI